VSSLAIPALREVRKEENRRSYSLSSASAACVPAHLITAAFSASEDADPPRSFSDLVEPSPNPPRASDALVVTLRHARPTSVSTDALPPVTPSSRSAWGRLTSEPRTLLRPAGEGKTGKSPRAPSVVSKVLRAEARRPVERALLDERSSAAPIRLLSARAPRQAGLRASSGLATRWFHHEALRPPSGRDARCVRPTSATWMIYVHPYFVSSRFALRLSPQGCRLLAKQPLARLAESWAPCDGPGYRVFHDTRGRFGGSRLDTRCHVASSSLATSCGGRERERGRCLPTAPAAIMPLTPLSPLPLARNRAEPSPCLAAVAPSSCELFAPLFPREEAAKTAVTKDSWKPVARDGPRCLPPTRILRRIRWPLQPRSHDRRAALGEHDDRWVTFRRHPGSRPGHGPYRNDLRRDTSFPFDGHDFVARRSLCRAA